MLNFSTCAFAVFVSATVFVAPVFGQDAPEPPLAVLDKIEVTGSNILRIDAESSSPLTVITRKQIERTGLQTISEVIRSIPQDNNGTLSNAFLGFAQGASGVSLRGLGLNSTLVLLNGRRMATYALTDDGQRSFVDLDAFPLDAVERIEILRDSGSAIYGSDAIGGVVNVILRRDYVGGQVNANAGGTYYGQGGTARGTLAWGTGEPGRDPYNVFFFLEAAHSRSIFDSTRPGAVSTDNVTSFGGTDNRLGWIDANHGVALTSLVGNAQPRQPNGSAIPGGPWYASLPGCAPQDNPAITNPNAGLAGCYWSPVSYLQVQPEVNRLNLFGRGTWNFSPTLQAFSEIGWFRTVNDAQGPPQPTTSTVFNPVTFAVSTFEPLLPPNHPDNPYGAAGLAAQLRYSAATVPFVSDNTNTTVRVLAGLTGEFYGWTFNTALLYVRNDVVQFVHGLISKSGLEAGLADGTYRVGQNFNLSSPATLAQVYPDLKRSGDSYMSYGDFRATREAGSLPGGPMGIATGIEIRHERQQLEGDFPDRPGDIILPGFSDFNATRNVTAVYAEIYAPVLDTLELNGALRWDHYSDYGNSATPKAGFKWTPIKQVALRGTYAGGFRAPGPSENGEASTVLITPYFDPLRCPATGLPSDCGGGLATFVGKGKPDIQPETSKGLTFGTIFQPSAQFSTTIDYYSIKRKNEITPPDFARILADPTSVAGAVVVRGPSNPAIPGIPGPVLAVIAPYYNATQTETSGIDLQVSGSTAVTGYGKFSALLDLNYIIEFKRTLADGTVVDYVGTHGPTVSANSGTPQSKATLTLNWDQGPWTVTSQIFYVAPIRNIANLQDSTCLNQSADGGPAPGPNCRIPSFTTVNLYGKYAFSNQWEVNAAIGNLFNRPAPFDPQAYGHNYNFMHQAGVVGPTFNVGVKYAWQ